MIVKINWKWIGVVALVIAAAFTGYLFYLDQRVVPEELLPEAIEKTVRSQSYRYHTEVKMQVEGRDELLSRVEGETTGQDYHFKGVVHGQEVEVYQIGTTTYFQDAVTGRWMVTPGNDRFDLELFMAEVNPLGNLNFTAFDDLKLEGREGSGPYSKHILSLKPSLENEAMQLYWKDFNYRLWIDRNKQITQVEIQAVDKANPKDTLLIKTSMWDFNSTIKLVPPE